VDIFDTEDEHDAEFSGPMSLLLEERCRRSNSHGSRNVDDILLVEKKETIKRFRSELKKRFNISGLGRLKKHLGVWYDWRTDNNGKTYIVASMTNWKTK
jgi:hypothetical protein